MVFHVSFDLKNLPAMATLMNPYFIFHRAGNLIFGMNTSIFILESVESRQFPTITIFPFSSYYILVEKSTIS